MRNKILEISSKKNERIREYLSLKTKKGREKYSLFLIEGSKLIDDAIIANINIKCLISSNKEKLESNRIDCEKILISENIYNEIAETNMDDKIIGIFEISKNEEVKSETADKILALYDIQDPSNVGAIIRTAVGTGYSIVFIKSMVDIFSQKVLRSSAGASYKAKYSYIQDENDFLKQFSSHEIFALNMDGKNIKEIKPPAKHILIVGNEGHGICDYLLENSTKIKVPMTENVESLSAPIVSSFAMIYFTL